MKNSFSSHSLTRLCAIVALVISLAGWRHAHAFSVSAATYTVSPQGTDSQNGTTTSPWKTLSKALSVLKPGDTLILLSGTYTEALIVSSTTAGTAEQPITIEAASGAHVTIDGQNRALFTVQLSGSHFKLKNITIQNSGASCLRLNGTNLEVTGLTIKNCHQHGILVQGQQITVASSTITNSVLENQASPHTHWGSGLKVALGAEYVTLRENLIYRNWGEGIAITRGRHVTAERNNIYDNFSVNLYIDNSSQVTAHDNYITCRTNSGFERDGRQALGISISEESYDGWGSQLQDIMVTNNLVSYCHRGISFYSAEVSNPGLRAATISHNTLWQSVDYNLYIGDFPETRDTTISHNMMHHTSGKLAQIRNNRGLSFSNNTWTGSTPPSTVIGAGDVLSATALIPAPSYTRDEYTSLPPELTPGSSPTPSPAVSPSPLPSPSPEPLPTDSKFLVPWRSHAKNKHLSQHFLHHLKSFFVLLHNL